MSNDYGEAFHAIRKYKNYSLASATNKVFSVSQLSKFERGETDLTIKKLRPVLNNITITAPEFFDELAESEFQHSILFLQGLTNAYLLPLIEKKRFADSIETELFRLRTSLLPRKELYFKLLHLIRDILNQHTSKQYISANRKVITEYLFQVDRWYQFELLAFINTLPVLELSFIKLVSAELSERITETHNQSNTQKLIVTALIHASVQLIELHEFATADFFLQRILIISLPEQLFFEKILAKFFSGYLIYQKYIRAQGLITIEEALALLREFHYEMEANMLQAFFKRTCENSQL